MAAARRAPDRMVLLDGRVPDEARAEWAWNLDAFRSPPLHEPKPGRLVLAKLHGSANWYEANGGVGVRGLGACSARPAHHEGGSALRPPVLSKGEPTEWWAKALYEMLEEVLLSARACIAIGFSFRDDYLRERFERTLAARPDFRLLMVAPDAGEWEAVGNASVSRLAADYPNAVRSETHFGGTDCLIDIQSFLASGSV